jgi:hypothetical protein
VIKINEKLPNELLVEIFEYALIKITQEVSNKELEKILRKNCTFCKTELNKTPQEENHARRHKYSAGQK